MVNSLVLKRLLNSKTGSHQANMTWKSATAARTLSRTGVFLRRQLWIWPIAATLFLAALAFGVRRQVESVMRENLRSELQTLLNVETAMVRNWAKVQAANATTLANDSRVRQSVYRLLGDEVANADAAGGSGSADAHRELRASLGPAISAYGYVGYIVADKRRRILSAANDELIGQTQIPEYEALLKRALDGEASICPPFPSVVAMKDETGRSRTGIPTMFVSAPIRDENFQVVAALALRIPPEEEFTGILELGQTGRAGETYAFDKTGRMVSSSRFENELILLGLLPDQPDSRSILNVQLRDPLGDMTAGYRPKVRRAELPLTRMAADAIAGNSGVDIEGYRDYRGAEVIGAWNWLPEHDLGIANEVDTAEAFRPLVILKRTVWTLLGLLALSSIAIFAFTVKATRLRREAQRAEIEAKQLGQYTLEEKLGAGAMGVVYKGRHAMLRRPTAIKLLNVDKVNDASIERFAREVQLTCQLNHPATVAIYDYGRTPEGVFYYAMEYLDGIDLQALVEQYGPQPEPRVIRILTQICGSLYEAHTLGLVHRDVKPANIMLNRRGCDADVVKVLDFGLVKALDEKKQAGTTAANALTGTPLYMAPEAIESPNSVDARSDLYAVGAVGYFLLTGTPVFDAASIVELCRMQVDVSPDPPSQRLGKAVSADVEHALLACLEKSRAKRPQTARDLAQLLAKCASAGQWSVDDAENWWSRHERRGAARTVSTSSTAPATAGHDRTIIGSPAELD
ncbi:MAG: serine/threonine protein kinase [Planctomycetaceae bacterium]